jgi:hypothetical protein
MFLVAEAESNHRHKDFQSSRRAYYHTRDSPDHRSATTD